jgi:hypothetical protein
MKTRSFDWRDLPALHRLRDQCVYLDNILVLTNGPIFAPAGALLSILSPVTGVYTFLHTGVEAEGSVLFGQILHTQGWSSAHLSFLAPESAIGGAGLAELVDQMAAQVGERGALHLIAEADEQTEIFDQLRQTGFGIYARQRIWKLTEGPTSSKLPGLRRAVVGRDLASVKFLYANLVPGLVQQVEPPPLSQMRGLVYYRGSEVLAYVEIKYGPRGIWVQPFVHPDAENVVEPIIDLLKNLPYRRSRPVYICVRSYQSWLDSALEKSGAQPSPSQGVMVRHLARRIAQPFGSLALESTVNEPTVPVAH